MRWCRHGFSYRVTHDVALQAAAADGTGDLAVVGNEHVRTDAAVRGAAHADHARQCGNTASTRNSFVGEKNAFEFTHRFAAQGAGRTRLEDVSQGTFRISRHNESGLSAPLIQSYDW
jgi:hypothetical protein